MQTTSTGAWQAHVILSSTKKGNKQNVSVSQIPTCGSFLACQEAKLTAPRILTLCPASSNAKVSLFQMQIWGGFRDPLQNYGHTKLCAKLLKGLSQKLYNVEKHVRGRLYACVYVRIYVCIFIYTVYIYIYVCVCFVCAQHHTTSCTPSA